MELELNAVTMEGELASLDLQEQPLLVGAEVGGEELALESPELLAELIIEEVSIDGMCGVY